MVFSHRFCVLNIFWRVQNIVYVYNILYGVQNLFVHVKRCLYVETYTTILHAYNKICTNYKRTERLCMRSKYFVCVQMLCGHARGFYLRTTCCICEQHVLYGHK